MKTRTKKCGAYAALAAVLLVTAMLVITCTDPVTPGGSTTKQEREREIFAPPPGKAYIRVSIPSEEGRTILPDSFGTVTGYTVAIIEQGNSSNSYDETDSLSATTGGSFTNFANDNEEVFIVTEDCTYDVTVVGIGAGNVAVAGGQGTAVIDNAGLGSVTITLTGVVPGETGTFNYAVDILADNPTIANMDIVSYPGRTATTFSTADLTTTASDTVTLPSGFYWLTVTMEKGPRYETVTHSHILHISANRPTTWGNSTTPITFPSLRKITYDVIYDVNGADAPAVNVTDSGVADAGWTHRGTVTKNAAFATDPVRTGFEFKGWFHDNPLTGTNVAWVFAPSADPVPTNIFRDTTLTAKWDPTAGLLITIRPYAPPVANFTFNPSSASYTLAQANVAGGLSIVSITVPLDNNDDPLVVYFDEVQGWYYNGNLTDKVSPNATLTTENIENYNLAHSNAIDFTRLGPHVFTFTGLRDGNPYSGTFTINITPTPAP